MFFIGFIFVSLKDQGLWLCTSLLVVIHRLIAMHSRRDKRIQTMETPRNSDKRTFSEGKSGKPT